MGGKQPNQRLPASYIRVARNHERAMVVTNSLPNQLQDCRPANLAWEKSSGGCIKLNVDGAVNFQSKKSVVGHIARDSNGLIIASKNIALHFYSPLIVELFAIWYGLQWVQEQH